MNTQTYIARITHPKTLAGRLRTACTTTLLSLLLLLALPAVVQAQFNYVITNGTITITGYTGPGGAVTIPNMIGGLPVSGIGFEAFYGSTNLTSVTLPNSVTNIGDWAFSSCTSLTTITVDTNNPAYSSVDGVLCDKSKTTLLDFPGGRAGSYTIPDSVTSIGDLAFEECLSLTNVMIGWSVTSIGDEAFYNCTNLTSVTIGNGVTHIGGSAFDSCTSLTNVTIPDSVTYMGYGVFAYCGLRTVTISHSLTNIADAAFAECTRLTSVTIPNTVTSIGGQAFDDCRSLTNVSIPNSVTSLEEGAFEYCPSLASITLPNSVTSIGDETFYECPNLTAIYCWGNAPTIGLDVFDWANHATVFYLSGTTGWGPALGSRPAVMWNPAGGVYIVRQPQGVATNVGASLSFSVLASGTAPLSYQWRKATTNLTRATNITFTITNVQPADAGHYTVVVRDRDGSTTSQVAILDVYEYATPPRGFFYTPNGNSTVTITGYTGPGGVVDIPDAINGLPVTAIGDKAFDYCTSLTSITIPDGVTSIGMLAFDLCTSLSRVSIPNHVISIGSGAFSGCSSLARITIPDSVTSIGEGAFSDCFSLTRITLPNRITSIGNETFGNCLRLTSVTIPDSVTRIGDSAFDDCTSLTNITIPNSVTSIGAWAFGNCTSLASVAIPNRLTSIRTCAFYYCTSLTNLTIPESVTSIEYGACERCTSLTNVTIPDSVANIGDTAFWGCTSLRGIYFLGNASSLGGLNVFAGDSNLIVYYVPGTAGWGTTFGGVRTAPWIQVPIVLVPPRTQTAEVGAAVSLRVQASSPLPLFYLWYVNSTNLISCSTNSGLQLASVQFSQAGTYTVVMSNALGAITSAPVMLNVIAPVERRPVPGVKLMGEAASFLNVDYADSLSPAPTWTPLGSVSLTGTSQYCFDLTLPLPPQRFYRAWQTGAPSVIPSLDLHPVPALTLTGSIGHSVRLDYINQFGPTDAWVTLDTVTLTNASQLYFDTSAPGQPQRLYRLMMP